MDDLETQPLRLRLPAIEQPPDRADRLLVSEAGEMRRPSFDEPVEMIAALRRQMVRVIDDDGRAVGPWAPELDVEHKLAGLRDMMLVRQLDARMLRAHRQGSISFYMQCLGEEAVACSQARALAPHDMHFPTYRQQGLLVAGGYPVEQMMNQVMSNGQDPLKGRQLPVMYSSKATSFFSISGNLATQYIQAVGWAMASALRGDRAIASAWIGEGSTAESDFHSALVFASTYQAPVILNVVNNHWAISTPSEVARGAAATFADRGFGFGIPALRVDGNDYLAGHAASAWAAERARRNLGPTLIEWVTMRVGAHSTSDDPTGYRDAASTDAFPLGDPIGRLRAHLVAVGEWDDDRHEALEQEVAAEVDRAYAAAERHGSAKSGATSAAETMFEDVYADPPRHLREQMAQLEGH